MAKYTLTERQALTNSSTIITLLPIDHEGDSFHPGQYAALRFKRFGRYTPARCFSMVNYSNVKGSLQFGFRVEGKFTQALNGTPLGTEIDVSGPFGEFVFDPDYDKRSVLLAGGIGITPMMSIIQFAGRLKLANKLTLIYSVRDQRDVPFADELLQLERQNPNFRVIFAVTEGETTRFDKQHVVSGRVTPELIEKASGNDFDNTSFFVCGPSGFNDAVISELRHRGTPEARINTEAFTQARASRSGSSVFGDFGARMFSVYGVSIALFLILFLGILGTDVAKNVVAEAKTNVVPASTTTTTTADDSNTTPTQTDNSSTTTTPTPTTSQTTTTQSTPTPSTTTPTPTQTTTPMQTQYYRQPVSTVS